MELVKLGKKGQVTIPKAVLKHIGIDDETPMLVETTDEGAIVLRQAGVYPIEQYSEARLREFETTNKLPKNIEDRLRQQTDKDKR